MRESGHEAMIVLELLHLTWCSGIFISLIGWWWRAGLTRSRSGREWHEFMIANAGRFTKYGLSETAIWPVVLYRCNNTRRPPAPRRAIGEHDGRAVRAIVRVEALSPEPAPAR